MFYLHILQHLNRNCIEMFATYKKIISPESSPILGPASPSLAPTNANANNLKETGTNANAMESLSLCDCCCTNRNKNKPKQGDAPATQDPDPMAQGSVQGSAQGSVQGSAQSKYEFGHATHYTYNMTSPRLLCEFETGTPPSP
jgi:hypothetical protein